MKRKEPSSPTNLHETKSNDIENPNKMNRMDIDRKDEKYDRQLRLWGNNGQQNLENAHVCLLNVTAAGTEALKCLILPGVGKFMIVDNNIFNEDDYGNNFFMEQASIGQPKSQVACDFLQELNPDSYGAHVKADPVELLESDPEFFKSFTIVICSRLNEHDLLKISNFLWHINVPLVMCDSYGMFGLLRIARKEHVIIESHPDNVMDDLRLDLPFHELVKYMDVIELDKMEKLEHSHTPYLVLLYKYLHNWRQSTGLHWPESYAEKRQIKDLLRSGVLKNEYGVEIIEENFDEAIQNVNNAFRTTTIPSDLKMILNDGMANDPLASEENSKFWILVRSLKEFVNQHGTLPLRGTLPDMFSDSKRYIELQNLYKNKSFEHRKIVEEYVREALNDLQLPASFITTEDVRDFCRNASFLHVQRGFSIRDEFKQYISEHKIKETLEQATQSAVNIYLTFRSIARYLTTDNFPIVAIEKLANVIDHVTTEIGLQNKTSMDCLGEMLRCEFGEIHTTASIMGGLCSQEVIKLITRQFIPVNNTYIYDGVTHETVTLKL